MMKYMDIVEDKVKCAWYHTSLKHRLFNLANERGFLSKSLSISSLEFPVIVKATIDPYR